MNSTAPSRAKKRADRSRQYRGNARTLAKAQPPRFTANLYVQTRRFRFINQTAGMTTYSITPSKLCALITMATSTTNVVQLFEAAQVHCIYMWAQANTSTTSLLPTELEAVFSGVGAGSQGPDQSVEEISVGMTRVARLKLKPAPLSQAAQWQSGSTTAGTPGVLTYFSISCPQGTVIDLILSLAMTSDLRASGSSVAVTGPAVAGQIYYLALDNPAGGTGSVSQSLEPAGNLVTIT